MVSVFPMAALGQDDLYSSILQGDQKASEIKLDLNKLTLNKIPIKELTIEEVKDLFGEPTVNENTWMADITGRQLFFHGYGLIFWFNPKNSDPTQKLLSMTIYLIDTWDDKNGDIFLAFPGKITPEVTSDYKVDDITSLFKNYNITIQSAKDYRIERAKSYGDSSLYHYDLIGVESKKGYMCFSCDEVSKFLDYITISF
jgi:hypothetical protein